MSVEDVQKVNQLAQELIEKGFAADREEAVKKAQEMLNKEITSAAQVKETDEKQNIAASEVSDDSLKNMIERVKDHVARQFEGYKNALLGLEKELRALKQQVEELKSRGVSRTAADRGIAEKKVEEAAEPDEEPMKVEKEEGEAHPKVGRNNPDDVSIEKMFYCGNK
ncbi:hypothetical protein GOV06_02650 [Candidatus Woesearchaeota archaeon]|nr:hypothetical protein [Candidatus Woesearchaeota archaeon]